MAAAEPAPEALKPTIARIDQLIALFNRRAMDLPDGLFDRRTQFLLNGAPYETLLGRSPDDPLILMLARGPAGYRFIVKAVQHAVPDVAVERGEVACAESAASCQLDLWLSGRLRGVAEPVNIVVRVDLDLSARGLVQKAAVTVDNHALARLRQARRLP